MADDDGKGELRGRARAAAQTWYEEMVRGRRSLVMAPWDEATWFEDSNTTLKGLGIHSEAAMILPPNPMRVGFILSTARVPSFVVNLVLPLEAPELNFTGQVNLATGAVTGRFTSTPNLLIIGDPQNFPGSGVAVKGSVFFWLGQSPGTGKVVNDDGTSTGHLLSPFTPPFVALQSQLGGLVSGAVWAAAADTTGAIIVTELVMRAFPKQ